MSYQNPSTLVSVQSENFQIPRSVRIAQAYLSHCSNKKKNKKQKKTNKVSKKEQGNTRSILRSHMEDTKITKKYFYENSECF